jgi:hypothetical protein
VVMRAMLRVMLRGMLGDMHSIVLVRRRQNIDWPGHPERDISSLFYFILFIFQQTVKHVFAEEYSCEHHLCLAHCKVVVKKDHISIILSLIHKKCVESYYLVRNIK